MKIEIDIDIESIVKEALKKKQYFHTEETTPVPVEATTNSRSKWEYGRKNGRRRTVEEMALHDLEKEKGRRLTPEEKGEAKAKVEMDETTENTIKEQVIKKAHIDNLTAEGMAAASKELAEEAQNTEGLDIKQDKITDSAASDEAKIPKTEDINLPNSLFV